MSNDRLDSWKAISDYLGRDVRTVQRWEQERRLPIHRVPGGGRTAVFAFTAEIDQWLRQDQVDLEPAQVPGPSLAAPVAPAPRTWMRVVAAAGVVGSLGMVWWGLNARGAPVSSLKVSATGVVAEDGAGRTVWSFAFPVPVGHLPDTPRAAALKTGGALLSAAYFIAAGAGNVGGGRLWRLSDAGGVVWQREVDGASVGYGAERFRAPWILRDWAEQPRNGAGWVALAWTHEVWWPSFVEVIDDAGAAQFRFDNPGWIWGVRWVDAEAGRLGVSGVSNVHDAGMAALLDVSDGASQAPDPADPAFRCGDCGAGRPLRYVVLPRSEVNRALGGHVNKATAEVRDGRILVRTAESLTTDEAWAGAEVVYEFDASLQLLRARFGDRYWEAHARLEQSGRLSHTRAACPDRAGPPAIREWGPDQGWRDVQPAAGNREARAAAR